MANPGGPLSMVGITPQFVSNLVTTSVSSGVISSANQLLAGVANQSLAQAGSALVGNAAGNLVNVGINSLLGTQVAGVSGLNLNTGANVLASTITPFVTGALAQGINQSIQNSLKGAGPLGQVLAEIGTGLVNQGLNGLTNLIGGGITPGSGLSSSNATKFFPGAGDEPEANYNGGGSYTLGSNGPDVVIAIRAANSGPQTFGTFLAINDPVVPVTQPLTNFTNPSNLRDSFTDIQKGNAIFSESFLSSGALEATNLTNLGSFSSNSTFFDPTFSVSPAGWTFICAPEEISWTTSNAVNRVDIFGTNSPPAISGTKGLREFTLNNALVEGFSRNKTVEAKVSALEDLLKYKSSLSGGFVNVPVYQVWANQKGYGQQAYFLLKSVQVKEKMRDLTGDSTRAYVDVSFVEVPAFQVDSGIDQAPFSQQGGNSSLAKISTANAQANVVALKAQAQAKAKPAPRANPARR